MSTATYLFSRWSGTAVETVNFVSNGANQIAYQDGNANGQCGDAGDIPYGYDAHGNLTGDGVRTYAYDAENRLVSVSEGARTTSYAYNGDGDRVSQMVDGVTTDYVIDTATPLTMVLAETTGTETVYYLHGLDLVAQNDGTSTEYFGYDGLGSVRQVLNSAGEVLFAQVFDPYGNPYASAGIDSTSWGFTGEQTDGNELIFLRARYYDPRQGRFTQRDLSELEMNPYLYAGGNPVNFADPTGLWRWWVTINPGYIFHFLIENYYEGTPAGFYNQFRQLEYPIPGTNQKRPDMFNVFPGYGDVYEIEPWFLVNHPAHGSAQAAQYVALLNTALPNLAGFYYNVPYNWAYLAMTGGFRLGTGTDWPGRFRTVMPGLPLFDLVADYTRPGIIEYWLELNHFGVVAVAAGVPLLLPQSWKQLVKPPGWIPRPSYQPAYLVINIQQACGYILIGIGTAIIAFTIAEDIMTGGVGIFDDVVTVPGGFYLINLGQRIAVYVQVKTSPGIPDILPALP